MGNRYDHIQEVKKFNPYHDRSNGEFTGPGATGAFAPLFGRTERGQALLNQYKEKHSDMGGAAPAKPAEQKKPVEYKEIDHAEARAMAKKLGQDRDQMPEEDYRQMATMNNGYFGTRNSFDINEALREGKKLSAEQKKTVDTMDRYMKPSPEDIKLTRMADDKLLESLGLSGISASDEDALSQIQTKVGTVYANPGYSSTRFDGNGGFFEGRPIKMNINAPKGTKMLVSPARSRGSSGDIDEAEIVLARNTATKINAIRPMKDRWGYYVGVEMDCEVIVLD